ncbi:MAG: transglycosylase SLT domain-containing protein [Stenotrophobium sp.]
MATLIRALRDLLLPFLCMVAVIAVVFLVSQSVTATSDTRPRHKVVSLARASRFQSGTPTVGEAATGAVRVKAHRNSATTVPAPSPEPQVPTDDQPLASETGTDDAEDNGLWADTYDSHFRKYSKRYFSAGYDWRWFKAQAIVESTLNPNAHSSAGAVGLMQIKPLTFRDIRRHHPEIRDLHTPRWNIAAGICYVRGLYDKTDLRALPDQPRLYLAFASYNAGYTRMLRVMRRTPPEETGWHLTLAHSPPEARNYVERIIKMKTEI